MLYLLSDHSVVAPALRMEGKCAKVAGALFRLPQECSSAKEDDVSKLHNSI